MLISLLLSSATTPPSCLHTTTRQLQVPNLRCFTARGSTMAEPSPKKAKKEYSHTREASMPSIRAHCT